MLVVLVLINVMLIIFRPGTVLNIFDWARARSGVGRVTTGIHRHNMQLPDTSIDKSLVLAS